MAVETILLFIVLIAGFYMAWNIGANDVANAIGTSVGSGALSLRQAVIVAAILEFCGAYFFGSHVTDMVQQGIVNSDIFIQSPLYFVFGMLSALIAAGVWLQIASYFGLPVSTTHSIIGAIVGFGTAVGGLQAVYWNNVAYIAFAWVLSPIIAAFLAYLIFNILRKQIFYAPCPVIAAKALTPKIVFVFTSTLSVIILFRGLKNIHLDFGWALAISLTIGLCCALVSFICVRRMIPSSDALQMRPPLQPETLSALEKATKQLKQARKAMTGDMAYRTTLAMEEVKRLTESAQKDQASSSTDYQMVERIFGYLQMMSACLMAFAHGANDVANAIGPLSAALTTLTTGVIMVDTTPIAPWTLAFGGVGIVIGLATWGWRVIETIGKKITELTPSRGFSAEFGAALTIVVASRLGLPISTTHTLVGAVLGVGLARGIEALNLNTTRDIIVSWMITVPAGAALSIVSFYILSAIF